MLFPPTLRAQDGILPRDGFEAFLKRTTDSLLHGVAPLMHAGESNDVESLKKLIASDVDVDQQNKHGWTALMLAAGKGNAESADMLLDAGADRNYRPKNDRFESKTALEILKRERGHSLERIRLHRYGQSRQSWEKERLKQLDAIIKLLEKA